MAWPISGQSGHTARLFFPLAARITTSPVAVSWQLRSRTLKEFTDIPSDTIQLNLQAPNHVDSGFTPALNSSRRNKNRNIYWAKAERKGTLQDIARNSL